MKLTEKSDLDFTIIHTALTHWSLNFDVHHYHEGYLLYMEILGSHIRHTESESLGGTWILPFLIWSASRQDRSSVDVNVEMTGMLGFSDKYFNQP